MITLNKFLNSEEKMAIHCNTFDEANTLCNFFARAGKHWINRQSYRNRTNWIDYKERTCYSNRNSHCPIEYYQANGYKIFEFKDILLEG